MNFNSHNFKKQNEPLNFNREKTVDVNVGNKTVDVASEQKPETSKIINPNVSLGEKIKAFLKFKNNNTAKAVSRPAPPSRKLELLTEEVVGVKMPKKILFTLLVAFTGSLILVFGFYFFLSVFGQRVKTMIESLQTKINNLRQETAVNLTIQEAGMKEAAEQVEAIYAIMSNRLPWVDILNNLETYTLPSVYYHGLTLDDSGKYTFAAQAESFADIINQVEIYKSAPSFIKKVEVSNFKIVTVKKEELNQPAELAIENNPPDFSNQKPTPPEQYVEFNLSLELAPEFLPTSANSNQPNFQPSILVEPTDGNQDTKF